MDEVRGNNVVVALELSGRAGSVAVGVGERLIVEKVFEHGLQHAAGVVPLVDACLKEAGVGVGDVGVVAVSGGPGSFTGLRISVTLAKTWAMAAEASGRTLRVVMVPTGRVIAENATAENGLGEARLVTTALDAKRGQVFSGTYRREGEGWAEVRAARLVRLADVIEEGRREGWMGRWGGGGKMWLIGEGLPYHVKEGETFGEDVVVSGPEVWRARAGAVWKVGREMAARGEFSEVDGLVPVYVRMAEAEEKLMAGK
jgi:tRNA threonylcarbamoyladenosine biosynthesis protein TsaB